MNLVHFLLSVELEGRSLTYNPSYVKQLHQENAALIQHCEKLANLENSSWKGTKAAQSTVRNILAKIPSSITDRVCRNVHGALRSYYCIALDRFVDVVCRQVIDHFLMYERLGPLAVLSGEVVLAMPPDKLEAIAGESSATSSKRKQLEREMEKLNEAGKNLRL